MRWEVNYKHMCCLPRINDKLKEFINCCYIMIYNVTHQRSRPLNIIRLLLPRISNYRFNLDFDFDLKINQPDSKFQNIILKNKTTFWLINSLILVYSLFRPFGFVILYVLEVRTKMFVLVKLKDIIRTPPYNFKNKLDDFIANELNKKLANKVSMLLSVMSN